MRVRLLAVLLWVSCAEVPRRVTTVAPEVPAPRLAVDTHIHLTMSEAAKPIFLGQPGTGIQTTSTKARLVNQISAPDLRAAGVRLLFSSVWPPYELRPGRRGLDEAIHQLDLLFAFGRRQAEFAVVTSSEEIRTQLAHGRIVAFPQVEGGEGIRSVDDVERLYAAGARCLVLLHFADSALGGAAAGQVGKIIGLRASGSNPLGLTELGKAVVTRMTELGMVIDVAHASDQTVRDVLDITEPKGVPILISHTGSRTLNPMERNTSDELIQRVAKGGGLIGISLSKQQLETDESHRLNDHVEGTCDDPVAHWKYLATLVPASKLIMGSDFNGFIPRPAAGGQCPTGIASTRELPAFWAALIASGHSREALDGMGDQLINFIETVEKKADPAAREHALAFAHEARTGFFEDP